MLRSLSLNRILSTLALCIATLLLSHCAFIKSSMNSANGDIDQYVIHTHPNSAVTHIDTSHITQVIAHGNMHINLRSTQQKSDLSFRLTKHEAMATFLKIHNHTLYIHNRLDHPAPRQFQLTVNKPLRLLSVHGNVSVNVHNLHTKALTVIDASGGKVTLNGMIDLQRLYASQHSNLQVTWVKSPKLVIYADDHAHISLAGIANRMYAHLTGRAHLDAQYLRTGAATVSTIDTSTANIFALNSLQAFAHNQSQINLFHAPTYKNQHTWQQAEVFMRSYRP